jgi:hypothetical protein
MCATEPRNLRDQFLDSKDSHQVFKYVDLETMLTGISVVYTLTDSGMLTGISTCVLVWLCVKCADECCGNNCVLKYVELNTHTHAHTHTHTHTQWWTQCISWNSTPASKISRTYQTWC